MNLYEWLDDVYAPLRNCAARTVDLYRGTIDRFRDFLGRTPELSDLNDLTVARFLQARQRLGVSLATVAKDRAQLAGMWTLAAKRHLVIDFPTLPPIRSPERVPVAWTIEQMRKILAAINDLKKNVGIYPARIWWRGLVHVMWDTGERVTAVLSIKIEDVDYDRGFLKVPAENRKNKTRDLLFQLSPDTLLAIAPLMDMNDQKRVLFPWPSWPTHIYWHWDKILVAAGLPTDRRSKFHRIRKSVATYYKLAGGDATTLLDHSNPGVTRKYIDPTIYKQTSPCDILPRLSARIDHPAKPSPAEDSPVHPPHYPPSQ